MKPERKDKKRKTGMPGIVLNTFNRHDRPHVEYRFQYKAQNGSLKTVYIGTEATWMDRYDEKLALAVLRMNGSVGKDQN